MGVLGQQPRRQADGSAAKAAGLHRADRRAEARLFLRRTGRLDDGDVPILAETKSFAGGMAMEQPISLFLLRAESVFQSA